MKWCSLYNCWYIDVKEVIDDKGIICDLECEVCIFEVEVLA